MKRNPTKRVVSKEAIRRRIMVIRTINSTKEEMIRVKIKSLITKRTTMVVKIEPINQKIKITINLKKITVKIREVVRVLAVKAPSQTEVAITREAAMQVLLRLFRSSQAIDSKSSNTVIEEPGDT